MQRRRLVLDLMADDGYITQAQAKEAYGEQLNYASPYIGLESAPHMVVYARSEVESLLVSELGLSQDGFGAWSRAAGCASTPASTWITSGWPRTSPGSRSPR